MKYKIPGIPAISESTGIPGNTESTGIPGNKYACGCWKDANGWACCDDHMKMVADIFDRGGFGCPKCKNEIGRVSGHYVGFSNYFPFKCGRCGTIVLISGREDL